MSGLNCCILSKFYIKPQPYDEVLGQLSVVSYRNSTSNHNSTIPQLAIASLYLIEILHQTTTASKPIYPGSTLYLIEILHQTTTLETMTYRKAMLYLIEILHQTTTRL